MHNPQDALKTSPAIFFLGPAGQWQFLYGVRHPAGEVGGGRTAPNVAAGWCPRPDDGSLAETFIMMSGAVRVRPRSVNHSHESVDTSPELDPTAS